MTISQLAYETQTPSERPAIDTSVEILSFDNNAIAETVERTKSHCELGFENLVFVDLTGGEKI